MNARHGRRLIAAVVSAALAAAAVASLAQTADNCLVGFFDPDFGFEGSACGVPVARVCTFQLQLCVNREPEEDEMCIPGAIDRVKVKARRCASRAPGRGRAHCGGVRNLRVTPSGDAFACGQLATLKVNAKRQGKGNVTLDECEI